MRTIAVFSIAAESPHCVASSPEAPSRNWTLNGQTVPSIGIRPGEQQFWRLVNAGSDTYLDIAVDNTQMQIVGLDGVPLASVGNAPLTVSHLRRAARQPHRIHRDGTAGRNDRVPADELLRFWCTRARHARRHARDDQGRKVHSPTSRNTGSESAPAREYSARKCGPTRPPTSARISRPLRSHGRRRRPTAVKIKSTGNRTIRTAAIYALSGTMEQWQIANASSQVHTFHIHQTHFLVQSIVGGTNASVSGATVTVTPAGAGSCVLVIADASGLAANLAISVTGQLSAITVSPNTNRSAATSMISSSSRPRRTKWSRTPIERLPSCGSAASRIREPA